MGFLDQLRSGELGVAWSPPDGWTLEAEEPAGLRFVSPQQGLQWHVGWLPQCIDLRLEHDARLRKDTEQQRRADFEDFYASRTSKDGSAKPPRTRDPSWSPIVELERVEVGGWPALRSVWRLCYAPTFEVVEGSLALPLGASVMTFHTGAWSRQTGLRESVIYALKQKEQPDVDPVELARSLRQADYDDPALDARWPQHPLSLVRAGLRWLMGPEGGIRRRMGPLPDPPERVPLPELGCSIRPPPRYLLCAPEHLEASPTLVLFSRVTGADAIAPTLDLWRHPDPVPRGSDLSRLAELARSNAQSWTEEGLKEIEMRTELRGGGALPPHVANDIRSTADGRRINIATRWLIDPGGAAVRIAVAGSPLITPFEELAADADAVLASLRWHPSSAEP